MKKVSAFLSSKWGNIIIIVLLVLLTTYLAVSVRVLPGDLPVADSYAENSLVNQIRGQIAPQINAQNPFLADTQKAKLLDAEVGKYIEANKEQFDMQKEAFASQIRAAYQHDDGQTYLVALDPYYYFRFVRNVLDHGYAGEYLNEEGKSVSNFVTAPTELEFKGNILHVQFSVFWHKFLNFFKDVPLHTSFFYVPVIIMALATIVAFFLGHRLGGNIGGVSAALIIGLHSSILQRTIAGFSDTDPYNVLFPLLIVWMIVEANLAKSLKARVLYSAAAGLSSGIFAYAWEGWWFMFAIVGVSFAISVVIQAIELIVRNKLYHFNKTWSERAKKALHKDAKIINVFIGGITYLLSTALFVTLFAGFRSFYRAFINPLVGTSSLGNAATSDFWPNVLTTVAELSNSTFAATVNSSFGGISKAAFYIGIIGILSYSIYQLYQKKSITGNILILVWLIVTLTMSMSGVRFIMLYVTAFAIVFAITLGYITKFLQSKVSQWVEVPKYVMTGFMVVVIIILFVAVPINGSGANQTSMVGTAYAIGNSITPSMNDEFYNMLINIKENSEPDAIISSWWDFGHQFITIAERGATGDGTTQKAKSTIWLGKGLIESNPENFIGISRMLNCGSNKAYEYIFNITNYPTDSIDILYSIFPLEREAASVVLSESFTPEQVDNILSYTHCEDVVESFWIASEDMIGKAPVWGHFGLWDFERAKAWELRRDPVAFNAHVAEKLNDSNPQALYTQLNLMSQEQGNAWISPWPRYHDGPRVCQTNETSVLCIANRQIGTDIVFNAIQYVDEEVTLIVTVNGQQQGVRPQVFNTVVDDKYVVKYYDNNTLPFGVSLIPNGNTYSAVLMDPQLTESMFNRMFFFEGRDLEDYFVKFDQRRTIAGQTLKVYKRTQ